MASSLRIVAVAELACPSVPPPAIAPSVAMTVSFGSTEVSGTVVTVKLALVAVAAKLTAPLFRPATL